MTLGALLCSEASITVKSRPQEPVLNEEAFEQLLSAAYVMQEHNARTRPKTDSQESYGRTLTAITAAHEWIKSKHLGLSDAMKFIAMRAQELTQATGIAIGLIDGQHLEYRAGTGSGEREIGSRLIVAASLSADCLRSGQLLQAPDASHDTRLPEEICRRAGVQSLIAAPIVHAGKVAGVVELRYAQSQPVNEYDLRTCQLMAGLAGEAITRDAAEQSARVAMMDTLETIEPELDQLIKNPATVPQTPAKTAGALYCPKCGHAFSGDEVYCGLCGAPRAADPANPAPPKTQKAWTSLWEMHKGEKAGPELSELKETLEPLTRPTAPAASQTPAASQEDEEDLFPAELEDIVAQFAQAGDEDFVAPISTAQAPLQEDPVMSEESDVFDGEIAEVIPVLAGSENVAPVTRSAPWGSAAKTLEWLESIKSPKSSKAWLADQWRRHGGSISLAVAAAFLLIVVLDWMMRPVAVATSSSGQPTATVHTDTPPHELTGFERLLINLGLAEAPPPPKEYHGNPNTLVWVDTHTALYYCPGADLYGKTADGKSTTQLDAQRDQFAPATRRPCD